MTELRTDRELLEEAWRAYDEKFAEYVGEVVTPYDYVDTEEQVVWSVRTFMFAYGLGVVAGAEAVASGERETDLERVETIVDEVVEIHASDAFDVSSERIVEDFLRE